MKRMILAAEEFGGNSTWYKIKAEDILKYSSYRNNVWIKYKLEHEPLEKCINLYYMDGSKVYGDTLYYLKTDYSDIEVDGEEVDPVDALDLYELEDLSEYISDILPVEVVRNITDDDILFENNEIEPMFEELIQIYPADQVFEDADELKLYLEYEKEHLDEYL